MTSKSIPPLPELSVDLPIETPRLRIRHHTEEDRAPFVALVTDPRFSEHLTMPPRQKTEEGAGEVFDTVLGSYETDEPVYGLTVADKDSDAFLGTVALHPVPFGDAIELFYAIVPDRWRQGLATEAVKAVLDALPEKDFVALTTVENEPSKQVALAAGMQDEGIFEPLGGPARQRFVRPHR